MARTGTPETYPVRGFRQYAAYQRNDQWLGLLH